MDNSLAVLLPVRNAERTLRSDVRSVLDATADLASHVEIVIIDDASKDDTFDVAAELATEFPQVRVVHCGSRRRLPEMIQDVRAVVDAQTVIVHDGMARVNVEQLRLVWSQQQMLRATQGEPDPQRGVSFADLRRPGQTQPAMESAHRRLMGFRKLPAAAAAEIDLDDDELRRRDEAATPDRQRGVGVIPPLPKSNMMGAITDFAIGE